MIKKLRSKLKWLEKLGFMSLSSIVLILIYNLFVGEEGEMQTRARGERERERERESFKCCN